MNETLVPVLNPADWGGAAHSVCRPFFWDDANSPLLVSYAVVTPEANRYLTADALAQSGRSVEDVEAEALQNWVSANLDPGWQAFPTMEGQVDAMAVCSESDIISTMLLSPGHLKGVHQHFGEEMLGVIIPNRFTLLVHPNVLILPGLAVSMYQEACADGTQMSPQMYTSMNGDVVGYAAPQEGVPQAPPEPEVEFHPVTTAATVIGGAFLMIAAADGTIDDEEISSFSQQLQALAQGGTSLAHQGCLHLVQSQMAPLVALMENGMEPVAVMAEIMGGMLTFEEKCGAAEAGNLRAMTKQIVTNVASASGGGFLGLGSKISKEEKIALGMLEELLG